MSFFLFRMLYIWDLRLLTRIESPRFVDINGNYDETLKQHLYFVYKPRSGRSDPISWFNRSWRARLNQVTQGYKRPRTKRHVNAMLPGTRQSLSFIARETRRRRGNRRSPPRTKIPLQWHSASYALAWGKT